MGKHNDDDVTLDVTILRESAKSWYVETADQDGDDMEVWIPKSDKVLKSTDCLAVGDSGYMDVAHWFAVKANLIPEPDDDDD